MQLLYPKTSNLFGFGDQNHSEPIVTKYFSGSFDGIDDPFRSGRDRLTGSRGIVGECSDVDHFETGFFDGHAKGIGREEAGVGAGKDVVDCRRFADRVQPGSDRHDQRTVVWGVEDQFSGGFQALAERLKNRDGIDQVFDDIHHGNGIEHQFRFHFGNVAVVDVEPVLTGTIGQRFTEFDPSGVKSHRLGGSEHHPEPRPDIEQFGFWLVLNKPHIGWFENVGIECNGSIPRVIGIVEKAFGVLFVVDLGCLALERFENKVALRAFFDDTVESIGVCFWVLHIVQDASSGGVADGTMFVGQGHLQQYPCVRFDWDSQDPQNSFPG